MNDRQQCARPACFLGEPYGCLVRLLRGEVGRVDRLDHFPHRVEHQLLGAVQRREGDAHGRQDALEVDGPG
jgi:hypothetical protein